MLLLLSFSSSSYLHLELNFPNSITPPHHGKLNKAETEHHRLFFQRHKQRELDVAMSSKEESQRPSAHRMSNLKSRGKTCTRSPLRQGLNVANASSNSLSAGTGGSHFNDSKTVELGANIQACCGCLEKETGEEEAPKRQQQGNKRKRPRLNRFKKNARKEEDLVTAQRQKLLKAAHFDMPKYGKLEEI